MIMNDTRSTHRSRVPQRSSGRINSDDSGGERTRSGLYFVICVWQSSVRGCRFTFVFVYFIIKVSKCSQVPASFFPYLRTMLQESLPFRFAASCGLALSSGVSPYLLQMLT